MLNKKQIFWLTFAISLLILFSPSTFGAEKQVGLDKIVHALLFLALAFTGLRAYPQSHPYPFFLFILYAVASEVIQRWFLSGRSFDWWDILFDTSGIIVGAIIFVIYNRPKRELQ